MLSKFLNRVRSGSRGPANAESTEPPKQPPLQKAKTLPPKTQQQLDAEAVRNGELPPRFAERVVELELKLQGQEYNEDEANIVKSIGDLMGLYSVSHLNCDSF